MCSESLEWIDLRIELNKFEIFIGVWNDEENIEFIFSDLF